MASRTLASQPLRNAPAVRALSATRATAYRRLLIAVLIVPLLVTAWVRVAPLIEGGDRLQRQCFTEDGYLMLTIARNIALNHGFSVSEGQIATNGTQPLATLIYAACFRAVGGERLPGLFLIVIVQILIAAAAAILLYFAVSRCFYRGPDAATAALLVAGVWFISPSSVMHTQNGLETGLATLLIIASIALYDRYLLRLTDSMHAAACLTLGAVLGLAFLARNDACLLIAALILVHLYRCMRRGLLKRALVQSFLIGVTSIVVASPWLWFNVSRFGHLMPVSGRSQSLDIGFATNLLPAFVALVENASLVLRVPGQLEQNPYVVFACMAAVLVAAVLAFSFRKFLTARFSPGIAILALFVAGLFVFYALFFGMACFLGRYLFPAVTLSAVILPCLFLEWLRRPAPALSRSAIVALSFALLLTIALNARIYRNGKQHMHFQVVDWVRENVPADQWVAAVQTGTLGFYHDRTINLDGKVNPEALEYRAEGRTPEYVVKRNVSYIADWASIATWADLPGFAENYELILKDENRGPNGLAVLRRRTLGGGT
ncbi:MAG: glycosyltransferase family 39 protein [Phycisphaerae bacterium]|nr:glycosyltransferase family 39 protein [Phycisphaerae bacterium]